jgi:hypothetical protein
MSTGGHYPNQGISATALDKLPPFVWPEARWHAGHGDYPDCPPFRVALREATLLAGVITGLADSTIGWLGEIIRQPGARRIRLVVAVYPAGPTRAEHLLAASLLAAEAAGSGADVQFRVLPVERALGDDCERPSLPPTLLYAQAENGAPLFCFGSTGDGGCDKPAPWSFNAVFQPDDSLRDAWRRWFGFITEKAVLLTAETAQIPHLAPARGDIEAARQWREFVERCAAQGAAKSVGELLVNPETGEVIPVTTEEGAPAETWDGDTTKLDPLAREFGRIYAGGKLVTVDESTRLKPLMVSVTAATFGEQSEKTVGNVRRKQQFILEILDEATTKPRRRKSRSAEKSATWCDCSASSSAKASAGFPRRPSRSSNARSMRATSAGRNSSVQPLAAMWRLSSKRARRSSAKTSTECIATSVMVTKYQKTGCKQSLRT